MANKHTFLEPFTLAPELFISMQYIYDNFENISPNIRSKLNFLAIHLLTNYAKEEQKSFFSLIRVEKDQKLDEKSSDLSQLEALSPEIATKVYFDTVNTLFPKSQLVLSSLLKKGDLQIRSQTLKLWGERHIELNYGQQILIIKKTSNRKPDKQLDLNTYSLRWLGEVKSRYCFALDSKTPKNHYKCFFIGSEQIELAREWHEHLRVAQNSCYISSFIEHRNKMNRLLRRSISPQRKHEEERKNKKEVKTLKNAKEEFEKRKNQGFEEKSLEKTLEKNINIPLNNSENLELTHNQNINEKKIPGSAPHQTSLFKFDFSYEQEEKVEESPTFKVLKEDCLKSPFVEKVNKMSFEDYTNLKKVKSLKSLKLGKLFERINKSTKKRKIGIKIKKFIKKKTCPFYFFIGNVHHRHNVIKLFNPFYEISIKTSSIRVPMSRNISMKENLLIYSGVANINSMRKNQNDSGFLDYDVKFNINLTNYLNRLPYKRIINTENLQLFKNKTKNLQFKEFFSFPKSYQNIIPFFINDKLYDSWNKNIVKRKILSINKNCNSLIIYEKRNYFKEILEIVYSRHIFENKEFFIIHDQSIDFNEISGGIQIKGEIFNKTMFIDKTYEENHNYTKIIIEIEFLSKEILKNLSIKHYFLQEFKDFINLKKVIKEKTSNKKIRNTMTIGMRRPLSYENEKSDIFKKSFGDEKRLVLMENGSTEMDYPIDILHQIRFYDDTQAKTSENYHKNCYDNEVMIHAFDKEELEKLKKRLKSINYLTIPINLLFIDSSSHWKYEKSNGFYLNNKKILKTQNKLIEILKKKYLAEKSFPFSFINLDYPIEFNEPQTLQMKIMYSYIFSLDLLIKASDCSDSNDQMKWVLAFLISLMKSSIFTLFPINSVYGETLKMTLKNNITIKTEMVRISPRQVSLAIVSPSFDIKATHEIDYILNKSDIKIKFFKFMEISFKKTESSKFQVNQFPLLSIYDLTNTKRTIHFDGNLLVSNKGENLSAVLSFGNLNNDIIIDEMTEEIPEKEECRFNGHIFKEYPIEEIRENEIICDVNGIWLKFIQFNDEVFWKFSEYQLLKEDVIMEGNCLNRGDWMEARMGNFEEAIKINNILKGKEKVNRWIELKKLKTSFY